MAGLYDSLMNGIQIPMQQGPYQGPQWMAGQPQPATPQQPSAPIEMTADMRGPSPFGVQAPASLPQQSAPLPPWVAEFLDKFQKLNGRR